jgi:putative ABC transport system permease protein
MQSLVRRLLALLRRGRLEHDLDDELTFHLAMREAESRSDGAHTADASLTARRQFGNRLFIKEQARDAWGFLWVEGLVKDVRHATRALRRSPGFAITTIVTLAIGVVATTVVFSVIDSLLLQPAPFKEPDRLVEFLRWSARGGGPSQPAETLPRWREQTHLFEQVEAHWEQSFALSGNDGPRLVWGSQVTVGLFSLLGVAPQLGRGFAADDASDAVAIIGDALWRRQFGASETALGQTLRLDDLMYTIVGVMPRDFRFPVSRVEIWIPFDPSRPNPQSPRGQVTAIARLRPHIPFQDADQQVAALAPSLDPTVSSLPIPGVTARLRTMDRYSRRGVWGQASRIGEIRTRLFLVFAAGTVLLLLSCVNAANLFMSRALARMPDLLMRAALGAGTARLLRAMASEALVISIAASVLGVGLAAWTIRGVASLVPLDMADASLNPIDLDIRAVAWAVLAALLTAFAAAMIPASRLVRRNSSGVISHLDRRTHRHGLAQGLLLVVQTGLAALLLISAGLMTRSLLQVLHLDTGWSGDGVTIAEPQFRGGHYAIAASRSAFLSDLASTLRGRSEVIAAVAEGVPLQTRAIWFGALQGEAHVIPEAEVRQIRVSPGYFTALSLRFERGRPFSREEDRQPVAVVSRSIAQQLWPDVTPIGQRFRFNQEGSEWLTVIGVVADVQSDSIERGRDPVEVYRPLGAANGPGSLGHPFQYLVVKAAGGVDIARVISDRAAALDPNLPVELRTPQQLLRETIAEREFNTGLLAGFSLFGLLLASAGVYALVSYEASRRTRELGIRIALGATAAHVVREVVARSIALSVAGAAAGVAASLAVTRVMTSMLYGVSAYDPASFAGAVAILLSTALAGAFVPALRATRVDPLAAVRHE